MQETIAVIFDFDDTLAPDSTSSFLKSIGVDVPRFWKDEVQPLIDGGWDPMTMLLHQPSATLANSPPDVTHSTNNVARAYRVTITSPT